MSTATIEITVKSATGLKKRKLLRKQKAFAVVYLDSCENERYYTEKDCNGDTNPKWNTHFSLLVPEENFRQSAPCVTVEVWRTRHRGIKILGTAKLSVTEEGIRSLPLIVNKFSGVKESGSVEVDLSVTRPSIRFGMLPGMYTQNQNISPGQDPGSSHSQSRRNFDFSRFMNSIREVSSRLSKAELEMTLVSAENLKWSIKTLLSRSYTYAVAYSDPLHKYFTTLSTDTEGGINPEWNADFTLVVDRTDFNRNKVFITVEVYRKTGRTHKFLGEANFPAANIEVQTRDLIRKGQRSNKIRGKITVSIRSRQILGLIPGRQDVSLNSGGIVLVKALGVLTTIIVGLAAI